SQVSQLLHQAGKILFEHRTVGICLTADRQSERIGVKFYYARGHEPSHCSIRRHFLEKLSSRNRTHIHLLFHVKYVQIKVECNQPQEMAAAFGVRWLDTALVVISGFYLIPGQKNREGVLSKISLV